MKTFLKILYCIGYAIALLAIIITVAIAAIIISALVLVFSPIIAIVEAIVDINLESDDNHCSYYVEGKYEEKL